MIFSAGQSDEKLRLAEDANRLGVPAIGVCGRENQGTLTDLCMRY